MQRNANTLRLAPAPKPDASQKLEQARERVQSALRAAEEGEMSGQTFDDIARPLVAAMRELEALQLTVAVMERRAR